MRLDTLYLARYLTLADMKAFRSITVFELMSGWWKRRHAADSRTWDNGTETDSRSGSGASEAGDAEDGAIEAFTRRANMVRCQLSRWPMYWKLALRTMNLRINWAMCSIFQISYWVEHEILSLAEPKRRKQLIKKFIEVAKVEMHT